jgi:hypothetical protein
VVKLEFVANVVVVDELVFQVVVVFFEVLQTVTVL